MGVFRDIEIAWDGEEFKIPANRVLQCIAELEEVITIQELAKRAESETLSLSKVAMAYGVILRYAGADISDDEVFQGLFSEGGSDNLGNTFTALFAMTEQPNTRISQVWTYFGERNPLEPLDEAKNFRSVEIKTDLDAETEFGSAAIKKVFSRWIPFGGRAVASRLNDIQLARFVDPPRKFKFRISPFGTQPNLGDGVLIGSWSLQNTDGTPATVPAQITRLTPRPEFIEVECEEALFAGDPIDLVDRVVIIDTNSVDSNGVKIVYHTVGEGPLVIFVHSISGPWHDFRNQIVMLSEKYRVVSMSTWHGSSSRCHSRRTHPRRSIIVRSSPSALGTHWLFTSRSAASTDCAARSIRTQPHIAKPTAIEVIRPRIDVAMQFGDER